MPDATNINYGVRLRIPDNVGYVAHAVATNDNRGLFPLTSILNKYGGRIIRKQYSPNEYIEESSDRYYEKPFRGSHSDVGGGYKDGTNLSALRWMYGQGVSHDVPFKMHLFRKNVGKGREYQYPNEWHDARYPVIDWGRNERTIYSGQF